ncbi:hypothetical protein M430DRAFT_40825 [Amorphotheca resinae ATCC 22711]|uniref:Uncharacterized protein n=1 Tax=Amorphotheca resinae ATCC 22711 TaxID=857342 RepID=A0A2T3B5J2_AMORE|nr:hypothetical protein M430DRAFT_40825 [Amorphotheca resinae ATCC 22711]PSS22034.1 hypothetical protein M430DRAFT_40825 [Amorphotheca resinae ATCC 22711]
MSGTGGYYKYRCKYWLTYNCPNWVWVNNASCAHCLAEGRDSETAVLSGAFSRVPETYVVHLETCSLHCNNRETIEASGGKGEWGLEDGPSQLFPTTSEHFGLDAHELWS